MPPAVVARFEGIVCRFGSQNSKAVVKNAEVKKLLNVFSNTVHQLRIVGKLKSSKVDGVHYYRLSDIEKLLDTWL